MKKNFFIVSLVIFILLGGIANSLFAEVKGIFTLNTYLDVNTFPDTPLSFNDDAGSYQWKAINTDTWNNLDNDWWMRRQDYWLLAYRKPSFLDFGFEAYNDNFNLVTRWDIMQDILVNLLEPSSLKTNIPFVGCLLDLTLPRVGFVEYTTNDNSFYTSLGRRLIKWGPGSYDVQIDASQPYLDNLWVSYTTNITKKSTWKFNYNYVLVSPKFWMDYKDDYNDIYELPKTVEKTILGHKFNFYNDYVRLSFGELANVYDKTPSLFDLSPLVIWHDGNQDDNVNVALYLSAEGKVGPVRMFGTFNMDDFDLPHETHSNKPQAMGFSAGIEYHVFDGNPIVSDKFKREDYVLKEATLKQDNGLNIGFEWYFVSPMMYNRREAERNGKFTIPFQFISLVGDGYVWDYDAFYLGFKYGPNARLFKLYAEYKDSPFEANFIAEVLTRGEYSIESSYGDRDQLDEMGVIDMMKLAGKQTTTLILQADFAYYLEESLKLKTSLEFQQDFTHKKNAFAFSIGFSCNPFFTDWKNLF